MSPQQWPASDPAAQVGGVDPERMPAAVTVAEDEPVEAFYRRRLAQQIEDWYAGVRISKLPEDLRTYEHLLWSGRVDAVVEAGVQFGGSALWFRDRLRTNRAYGRIGPPLYVGLDLDVGPARAALDAAAPGWGEDIRLVEGNLHDPGVLRQVHDAVPEGARCLVVEDSAHDYETTLAALRGLSDLVPAGGWFVVEDGCVDVEGLRLHDAWPRGVQRAITDWLGTEAGRDFAIRRDLELYGLTAHPQGFLERRR